MGCKTILLGGGMAALLVHSLALTAESQQNLSAGQQAELGSVESVVAQVVLGPNEARFQHRKDVEVAATAAAPIAFGPAGTVLLNLDSQYQQDSSDQ